MDSWWTWLFGYVVCRMRRGDRQALFELLRQEDVDVWDVVEEIDADTVAFCLSLRDYRRIVRKTKTLPVRIQIVDKRGLPFYFWRAKRRKSFWAGALAFVLLLALSFQFIWSVEVVGNEHIPADDLLAAAAKLGLKEGAFRHRLPSNKALQTEFLSRFPGLTWVGVEVKGTKALIRVVESKSPAQRPLVNPRHLVAAKGAIVKEIFVEQGTARVRRNQAVKKGDILIAGYMGEGENRRIVSAQGTVLGLVWYEVSATVPLAQEYRQLSGESFKKTSLLIGSRLISFDFSRPDYRQYKVEETVRLWRLGNWALPLGLRERTYYKTGTERRTLTRREALDLAKTRSRDDLMRRLGDKGEIVMEKVLQETVVNGTLKVKLYYEVLEEIAEELPILPEIEPLPKLQQSM